MWFLSIRYLLSKPKQTFLTLTGVVLGTAAFVAISGMMLGFQTFIINQLVNNDAHIRITARDESLVPKKLEENFYLNHSSAPLLIRWLQPPSGKRGEASIANVHGWMNRLSEDPDVDSFVPQINVKVMIRNGRQTFAARLVGVDPEKQKRVSTLDKFMTSGRLSDIGQSGNRVIIGQTLLENLGSAVGQTLWVTNGAQSPVPVKVVGTFLLGVKGIDDTTLYGALSDAQKINLTPGAISDLAIRLNNVEKAREKAENWSILSHDKVQSWDQANESILSVFKTQDIVRLSMTVSILIVAGFGIFNILTMAVTQKKREIAILRSIGFEPKSIEQLFFNQGIVLGLAGGLLGAGIGYVVCLYMASMDVGSGKAMGTTGKMLVDFSPSIYLRAILLAFFSCGIASYLPARAAGKMHPMDIIRSE